MPTRPEAKEHGASSSPKKIHGKSAFDGNQDQNENENGTDAPEIDQQQMPLANIARIIHQVLPRHAKISDDATETIQNCVSKFITIITSKANKHCHDDSRVKITAEDVLVAMEKLKLGQYLEPLKLFLARYRENEKNGFCMHGNTLAGKRSYCLDDYGPANWLSPTLETTYRPLNGLSPIMPAYYGLSSPMGPNQSSSAFAPMAMSSFPDSAECLYILDFSDDFDPFAQLK